MIHIRLIIFVSLFSGLVYSVSDKCLKNYSNITYTYESPNASIDAIKYKKAIARSFLEINELINDINSVNPELSKKILNFFTDVEHQRFVDGGAGLSIYGVELALKGAKVKAFSGQNFLSLLKFFEDSEFMKKFIPSTQMTHDHFLFSVRNLNRMDIIDGFPELEFPIKGEALYKMAVITNNQDKYTYYANLVGVLTHVEIEEIRSFVSGMIKQYIKLVGKLEKQGNFSYYHMLDSIFFKSEESGKATIDRYIDYNGAFYYKPDKVNYLNLLLEKLSPSGKAVLVFDGRFDRFTVGDISLAEYLVKRWPQIFMLGEISRAGIFGQRIIQQILYIEKPRNQKTPNLLDFLELDKNIFSEEAFIPITNFKEKSK